MPVAIDEFVFFDGTSIKKHAAQNGQKNKFKLNLQNCAYTYVNLTEKQRDYYVVHR